MPAVRVPQGRHENSPARQCWVWLARNGSSPVGTTERKSVSDSAVPTGLFPFRSLPSTPCWAIFIRPFGTCPRPGHHVTEHSFSSLRLRFLVRLCFSFCHSRRESASGFIGHTRFPKEKKRTPPEGQSCRKHDFVGTSSPRNSTRVHLGLSSSLCGNRVWKKASKRF